MKTGRSTPGPWHAIESKYGVVIRSQHKQVGCCELLSDGDLDLILAAPELLQAMREIAEATVDGGAINKIARAAINLAEQQL